VELLEQVLHVVDGVVEWRETRAGKVIGDVLVHRIAVGLQKLQKVFDWIVTIVRQCHLQSIRETGDGRWEEEKDEGNEKGEWREKERRGVIPTRRDRLW
jgi:hypothetical protein